MKKNYLFIFALLISIVLFGFSQRMSPVKTLSTNPSPPVTQSTGGISSTSALAAEADKTDKAPSRPMAEQEVDAAFLAKEMPSLLDFTREYKGYELAELETELNKSQSKVTETALIEKSNAGLLNKKDMKTLIFEMKKQDALNTLIVKNKIEILKKKYL